MTDSKWIRNPSDSLAIEEGCYFSEPHGKRACDFMERFCRQSKGRWRGKRLQLLPWQRDFVMRAFGWRRSNGMRRFRVVYLEVAKKNGKSTLASAIALYLEVGDGEGAPEVYLNAVDKEQAAIIWEEAERMVSVSPELSRRLQSIPSKRRIIDARNNGKIQANSADVPSKDGLNASGIIFDELHRFKDRKQWDVFKYAGASRDQPLTLIITTAGPECRGIWHDLRQKSEQINSGLIPNTDHLGIVYRALTEADEGGPDDVHDPLTWRKANPSLGHTIKQEDFAAELADAERDAEEWANFLRLRLNIVIAANGKYLSLHEWDACPKWTQPGPEAPCFLGLDLSDHEDLTALVGLTGDFQSGFDAQCRFWLPKENIATLERRHGLPYRIWAKKGLITLTPGNTIDQDFIEKEILELVPRRNVVKILIDPWNAKKLAENLQNRHGLPVEYIRQGYLSLSDPTKTLRDLIRSGKIRHGDHPILRLHAANAVARRDAAGNVKLDKQLSSQKIDGMAAMVNACAGAIAGDRPGSGPSVYESRGLIST